MKTEAEITKEVADEFARIEADAGPGVKMLLEVYGGAEEARAQAEAYLSAAERVADSIITTSSTYQK